MKGAPVVAPVHETEALPGAAVAVAQSRTRVQLSNIKAGVVDMPMPNGGTKPFKLVIVPAEHVEKKTMVSPLNERDQQLLTVKALSDILPSVKQYGVSEPVMARDVHGVLEIAKGSRRRACAIYAGTDLPVLVGELTDEDVTALDRVSNYHLQPSPWERGRRYTKLVDRCGSLRKAEEYLADIGEKVSRRDISRCISTYLLPVDIIRAFDCPNDLSARTGETLGKLWESASDDLKAEWIALANRFVSGDVETDDEWDADKTAAAFKALHADSQPEKKEAPKPLIRSWGGGRVKMTHARGKARIELNDVEPSVLEQITKLIAGELQLPADDEEVPASVVGDAHKQIDLLSLEYSDAWDSLINGNDKYGLFDQAWTKFNLVMKEFSAALIASGTPDDDIAALEELASEQFRKEEDQRRIMNIREIRMIISDCVTELGLNGNHT